MKRSREAVEELYWHNYDSNFHYEENGSVRVDPGTPQRAIDSFKSWLKGWHWTNPVWIGEEPAGVKQ